MKNAAKEIVDIFNLAKDIHEKYPEGMKKIMLSSLAKDQDDLKEIEKQFTSSLINYFRTIENNMQFNASSRKWIALNFKTINYLMDLEIHIP